MAQKISDAELLSNLQEELRIHKRNVDNLGESAQASAEYIRELEQQIKEIHEHSKP